MAELELLAAVEAYLSAASLAPAPTSIGIAEPDAPDALPALVLSLEETRRSHPGLGERATLIQGGALAWQATIDLAKPFLDDDASFSLVSDDRTQLILPHGGLVRKDGSDGPLAQADLTVTVAGIDRPVVSGPPSGLEVAADPLIGRLTFATALPDSGTVAASYYLGQWEQRLVGIGGVLRVDACAASADDARALGDATVAALLAEDARRAVRRLLSIQVASLSSTSPAQAEFGGARRRTLRFAFQFELEVDRPDSSGGVIHRIDASIDPGIGSITDKETIGSG